MSHWQDEREKRNEENAQRAEELKKKRLLKEFEKAIALEGAKKNAQERQDDLIPDL